MWTPVATPEQFVNGRLVVRLEGEKTPVLLLHVGEEVFALANLCTHAAFALDDGELEGEALKCIHHGAKFNLRTGKGTFPAVRPVKTYKAKLEDGQVWLEV